MQSELVEVVKAARNGLVVGGVLKSLGAFFEGKGQGLRGTALLSHTYAAAAKGGKSLALYLFTYRLLRFCFRQFLLRVLLAGNNKNAQPQWINYYWGIATLFSGSASSLVTYSYSREVNVDFLLYAVKMVVESMVRSAVEQRKLVTPPGWALPAVNALFLGLFFYFFEREPQTFKPSFIGGTKRLLADA
ncbi:hypothetical protein QOT17_005907 [Balamuthia mandrillaris]